MVLLGIAIQQLHKSYSGKVGGAAPPDSVWIVLIDFNTARVCFRLRQRQHQPFFGLMGGQAKNDVTA